MAAPGSGAGGARPGLGDVEAVDLELDELVWIEDHYRGSRKLKTRRQVRRIEDGIENHGPYERWLENGILVEEGRFEHGERVGEWILRYDTGQPKLEETYVDGRLHGLKREWSDVGFVKKEAWFEEGLRHGDFTTWDMRYEGRRFVKTQGRHERGRKVGEWIVYWRNEKLREKGLYVDGLREGPWTFWYLEGELEREAEYAGGEFHGRVAEYDELGRLTSEAIYEGGAPNGPFIEFYPEGGVRSEKLYVDGQATGTARTFHRGGAPESEGELVDGEREGPWTFWNEDGSVNEEWTGEYRGGELVADAGGPPA